MLLLKQMNFLFAALVAVLLYIALRVFVGMRRSIYDRTVETVVLRVAVSRLNERGPIVAEQIFSALHGLETHYGWLDSLLGRSAPRISLEIASVQNQIQFFIWSPRRFKGVIENQIYAQYPDVEIEEMPDYAQVTVGSSAAIQVEKLSTPQNDEVAKPVVYNPAALGDRYAAVTAELKLVEPDIYPIKRYTQFEDKLTRLATETLGGITATLSKLGATDEQAWIQIVVQPVGDWWRKRSLKSLRILNKGLFKNIFWLNRLSTDVLLARGFWKRLLYSPLYFIFWVLRGVGSADLPRASRDLDEEVSASHDREDPITGAVDKVSRLTFDAAIRLVYIVRKENLDQAEVKLKEIAGSFRQFNMPQMNGLTLARINQANASVLRRYRLRQIVAPIMLNVQEVATLYHMPNKDVGTPNVVWVNSRKLEPPSNLPLPGLVPDKDLTIIGETNFRGHRQQFGIKGVDRRRHMYIIGKTGMGKSVLLENMIYSDVMAGRGLAVVDPHGDLADAVVDFIPSHRTNDVVILDPSDTAFPFAFNMLELANTPEQRNLVASGILGVFKKLYADSWGPRLEHILRNTLLALSEYPNTSMLGVMRILVDDEYRRRVVSKVDNPMVRSFWVEEFGRMDPRLRTEAISPIQNKVGQFLSSSMIRNIMGQVKSTVNIRFMMDTGKIIIVNLSKGKIGEDNSSLLGSMLITKFQLDAMSRADIPAEQRKDFYLYVDEFQNFATDSFATILSEARKYKLNLVMANQYIAQMPDEVRDAVFGNVGSLLTFQVGYEDAEFFSGQYSEEVLPNDLVSLPKYNAYMKLLVDGMPTRTFSLGTLPPPEFEKDIARREKVIRLSRERYCTAREIVEDKIRRWSKKEDDEKLEAGSSKKALPKAEAKSKTPAKSSDKNPKSSSKSKGGSKKK